MNNKIDTLGSILGITFLVLLIVFFVAIREPTVAALVENITGVPMFYNGTEYVEVITPYNTHNNITGNSTVGN